MRDLNNEKEENETDYLGLRQFPYRSMGGSLMKFAASYTLLVHSHGRNE